MTQLIINNTEYPETSLDKYKCYLREVGEQLRMASGRAVFETAYRIWVIEYSYDYFEPELMRECFAALSIGATVDVQFLAPNSNTLQSGFFIVNTRPSPTYSHSQKGLPLWHNINFKLEGARAIA